MGTGGAEASSFPGRPLAALRHRCGSTKVVRSAACGLLIIAMARLVSSWQVLSTMDMSTLKSFPDGLSTMDLSTLKSIPQVLSTMDLSTLSVGGGSGLKSFPDLPASCTSADTIKGVESEQLGVWRECLDAGRRGCSRDWVAFFVLLSGEAGLTRLSAMLAGSSRSTKIGWLAGSAVCLSELLRRGSALPRQLTLAAGAATTRLDFLRDLGPALQVSVRFVRVSWLNVFCAAIAELLEVRLRACLGGAGAPQEASGCQSSALAPLRVNVDEFEAFMEVVQGRERVLREGMAILENQGHQVLRLTYEEVFFDENSAVSRLAEFLGADAPVGVGDFMSSAEGSAQTDLQDGQVKWLKERVENWVELVAKFCGTDYEKDLGTEGTQWCNVQSAGAIHGRRPLSKRGPAKRGPAAAAGAGAAATLEANAHALAADREAALARAEGRLVQKEKTFELPSTCMEEGLGVDGGSRLSQELRFWQQCGIGSISGCQKNFTPFLIMFGGQTGTTHLAQDVLARHPELTWIGEGHDDCFLDMLRSGAGLPGSKVAVGTKTQIVEVLPLLGTFIPPKTRFIHFTRLNAIAWGLSKLNKEELKVCRSGDWVEGSRTDRNCTSAVYGRKAVDVKKLRQYVGKKVAIEKKRNQTLQTLESKNHAVLHVSYEEVLADEPAVIDRITRFLGISSVEKTTQSNVTKKGSHDLRGSFANWAEVVAAFCGTELERDLGLASDEPCVHEEEQR